MKEGIIVLTIVVLVTFWSVVIEFFRAEKLVFLKVNGKFGRDKVVIEYGLIYCGEEARLNGSISLQNRRGSLLFLWSVSNLDTGGATL